MYGGFRQSVGGLSSREDRHGHGAERAHFQGERRCCLGPWEIVPCSHTRSTIAGDPEGERTQWSFCCPGTPSVPPWERCFGCPLFAIVHYFLLQCLPLLLGEEKKLERYHISRGGSQRGGSYCIWSLSATLVFLRLLIPQGQACSCVVI